MQWRLKLKKAIHDSWVKASAVSKDGSKITSYNNSRKEKVSLMCRWRTSGLRIVGSSLTSHKKSMAKEEKWQGTDAAVVVEVPRQDIIVRLPSHCSCSLIDSDLATSSLHSFYNRRPNFDTLSITLFF